MDQPPPPPLPLRPRYVTPDAEEKRQSSSSLFLSPPLPRTKQQQQQQDDEEDEEEDVLQNETHYYESTAANHASSSSPSPRPLAATTLATLSTTRLRDIIGHEHIKLRLDEVLLPLALPVAASRRIFVGLRRPPTSILFFGPPGCGKTQLAQAVAGEAGAAFIAVSPSDILSKFVGEGEAAVRHVFVQAAHAARHNESRLAVLFWDEIDALGQARGGNNNTSMGIDPTGQRGILAELLLQCNRLQEMAIHQGDDDNNNNDLPQPRILLLAATNRPQDVDPALLRRFGLRLHVGSPSIADRGQLLRHYLRDIDHVLDASEWQTLAAATNGWSGCELEHLCREAVMAPVRECLQVAARQRRKKRKYNNNDDPQQQQQQQHGDNDDDEEQDDDDEDAMEAAREHLLTSLEHLRPVTWQDFVTAIDFVLAQAAPEEQEGEEADGGKDGEGGCSCENGLPPEAGSLSLM